MTQQPQAICDQVPPEEVALAVVVSPDSRPDSSDTRELVPAAASSNMEEMLAQMMAENRALRLRLEQMENPVNVLNAGSMGMPLEVPERSPVSFAPDSQPGIVAVQKAGRPPIGSLLDQGMSGLGGSVPLSSGPTVDMGLRFPMPIQGGSSIGIPPPPIPPHLRASAALEEGVLRLPHHGFLPPVPPLRDSREGLEGQRDLANKLEAAMGAHPSVGLRDAHAYAGGCGGWTGCGSQSGSNDPGFQTPRSSVHNRQFDKDGYPVSPGGTVIRPPPGPPPVSPRHLVGVPEVFAGTGIVGPRDRPEEPAKYVFELPKLPPAELSTSAVACGNWIAQIRQVFAGLSPSSAEWWSSVERAAGQQYQRWLTADPVDRLLLDPTTVLADFDLAKYQRVESRAVTLMLAAVPQGVRDEAVCNRWLTTASLLFRVQCIYQPGGSSERAMLLSHLVNPEVVKSYGAGVTALRKWQQNFHRVRELQAALPDSSLLLKGVDSATSHLLSQNPLLGFRVNAFRNRVSLDYNPSVLTVLQLVRLLQAEFEAAAITVDPGPPDKKARAAAASIGELGQLGRAPLQKPPAPPGPEAQAKALEVQQKGLGKGKGKEKGGEGAREQALCHGFSDGKGCKYGDSCRFRHDRALARKQKRCLACGQEGHYRPECPLVSPENRVVQDPTTPKGSIGSVQGGSA